MMPSIGIDYGTSNSEVTFFDGQRFEYIHLDPLVKDSNKIRSSAFIYYPNELPPPPAEAVESKVAHLKEILSGQINKAKDRYYDSVDPNDKQRYSRRIDDLRAEFHNLPVLQRKAIQLLEKDRSVHSISLETLVETGTFAFGEDGFRRFLKHPDKGRFINSPKNFLGSSLDDGQKKGFIGLIGEQLSYFKQRAEEQLRAVVDNVVIGRPVKFHGTRGEQGNQQALSIMAEAANKAGFTGVSFLEEPIAAAYKIERQLTRQTTTLVVDIGGGTTDICCINLSPNNNNQQDRRQDVLSVTGERLGGLECDKALVLKGLAPEMGSELKTINGLPIPPSYFTDMCAVDNIPALSRFFSDDYGLQIAQTMSITVNPEKLDRLLLVQENKLSARVVNSARMAKELLSERENITVPLKYIQEDFAVNVTQATLRLSMRTWLNKVTKLIRACLEKSPQLPQAVMVTGGMSLSPIVLESLTSSTINDLPVLENDAFNSVCEGLAIQAYKQASAARSKAI